MMFKNTYYLDKRFVELMGMRLEQFRAKGSDVYIFRCPLCGDSQRNRRKLRGFFFPYKDGFIFKCHNCGESCSVVNFMKKMFNDLHSQYLIERLMEDGPSYCRGSDNGRSNNNISDVKISLIDTLLDNVLTLPDDHVCVKYVKERKIPKEVWKYLYYIDSLNKIGQIAPKYENLNGAGRLLFLYYDKQHQLGSISCREIGNSSAQKYINVYIKDGFDLPYGYERIDETKTIFIVEGQIDSLFLENSVAASTSELSRAAKFFHKERVVLIPDAQPRNREIVKLISRWVDQNYSICLLPETFPKDINEFFIKGGTYDELMKIINDNTSSGLTLRFNFTNWKKI